MIQLEWPFGTGLSYSKFEYSALSISRTSLSQKARNTLVVSVDVTNKGPMAGKHTALMYIRIAPAVCEFRKEFPAIHPLSIQVPARQIPQHHSGGEAA